eukprot:NODE_3002_length_716_cov_1819.995502_g2119_i0.p2 GENE.NODE_3002_length_716_cov_1819.995502_g2119_i0~~NODE_3002_length_716_cov_1819.995502_g2119_i0.p2  ORF type:complete len:168 (-),score=90.04 NODE_3002_length_716_cov_1819.995502_g2119_i0:213-662(-)
MALRMKRCRTGSRRKNRKAYFNAPSHIRRLLMASRLSKELRSKHSVRAIPVRKDDEVRVMRGVHKGRDGKVVCCQRNKYKIHIDKITREKANGATVNIGIHPSNVEIIKIKMDKNRKELLLKKRTRVPKSEKGDKGKVTQSDVAMQDVD